MSDDLEVIENELIQIDGRSFVGKHVRKCVLVYSGGTPPIMRDSVFEENTFRLEGAARNTIDFFQALAFGGEGGAELVGVLLGMKIEMPEVPMAEDSSS